MSDLPDDLPLAGQDEEPDAAVAKPPAATARTRPKPGERRVQILQTLARMLEQPGAERITTAALAARLEVSEAALYRHFASKAQMFEGLIEFIESSVFTLVNQLVEREPSPSLQAQKITTVLLQFGEKNPGMVRVMVGDALVFEHERLTARMNQFFDRVESHLRNACALRPKPRARTRPPSTPRRWPRPSPPGRGPAAALRAQRLQAPAHRAPGPGAAAADGLTAVADDLPAATAAHFSVGGVRLQLLAERAVFLPEAATLLVADAHIGKAQSFRRLGVPVPSGTTADGLARLTALLQATDARRIVFLGDLMHAASGRSAAVLSTVAAWREAHGAVELLLVRGNHDRHAGDPPGDWRVQCVDEPFHLPSLPGLGLAHHPHAVAGSYVLAGHVHPAAVLGGRAHQRLRLPCFHFGPQVGLLPAFGGFTGSHVVQAGPGDQVFVIAGDEVRPLNSRP